MLCTSADVHINVSQWSVDEELHHVDVTHTLWPADDSRDVTRCVMADFQVCCVYFNFIIRLQNVIMFSSSKTCGECESGALELSSGPSSYLQCARRALGKRSEAVTVERRLFHMTDFPNCSKINQWQERGAAAAAGWEDSGCLRGDTCLSGVPVMSDARCEDGQVTLRVPEYTTMCTCRPRGQSCCPCISL